MKFNSIVYSCSDLIYTVTRDFVRHSVSLAVINGSTATVYNYIYNEIYSKVENIVYSFVFDETCIFIRSIK